MIFNMTQEEKAKRYDEALRRARKLKEDPTSVFYEYSPSEGDTVVDYIFSELKESEDERIRETLIENFKWFCGDYPETTKWGKDDNLLVKDILAWLEKQGEQKQLYIRFGEIPTNEKSKIYQGEIEVGTENGVSVYPAFKTAEGDIILGLSLPITKTTLYTQQHLIEYDNRPCYLVKGNYVGKDIDGQPLINNVSIIKKIDSYRVKEEKQGEHKSQGKSALEAINEEKVDNQFCVKSTNNVEPKFKVSDIIINIYYRWNGKHRIREITDGKYIFDSGSYIDIKEQDSWELANNVEPKFHEGQWIVWQDKYYKVNYNGCGYELIDQNGASKSLKYGTIDETAHHWGVSDAKDGDVLIDTNENFPFIFKQLKPCDIKTVIKNPLAVLGYCGIGGAGFTKGEGWGDTANCTYYPATKEQRDTLMKIMANAGYTFDFEKKELKKIENETEIPFSSNDSELIEESYYIPKGFHAEIYEKNKLLKKENFNEV